MQVDLCLLNKQMTPICPVYRGITWIKVKILKLFWNAHGMGARYQVEF